MSPLFYIANGLVMPPAMFFAGNYYRFRGKEINFKRLWISFCLLSVTVIVTGLQFVFPEIIPALDRTREAPLAGEVWRLVTPLFIQPMGPWQCFFNGLFFISFVPIGEHFYSRGLILIYFGTGIVGQIVNFYWEKPGGLGSAKGGSSTALYGVIGSLFIYILIHRKTFPKGYIWLSVAGFLGATILCFFEDGHAPSLLTGGLLGLILHRNTSEAKTAIV